MANGFEQGNLRSSRELVAAFVCVLLDLIEHRSRLPQMHPTGGYLAGRLVCLAERQQHRFYILDGLPWLGDAVVSAPLPDGLDVLRPAHGQ